MSPARAEPAAPIAHHSPPYRWAFAAAVAHAANRFETAPAPSDEALRELATRREAIRLFA